MLTAKLCYQQFNRDFTLFDLTVILLSIVKITLLREFIYPRQDFMPHIYFLSIIRVSR